jgi:hypothetical protein
MNRLTTGLLLGFGVVLFLLATKPTKAQQEARWTWEDYSGKTHTRAELDDILKASELWVNFKSSIGRASVPERRNAEGGGPEGRESR